MSKEENTHDEEGMFSKKHLCGYSCACCEKKIVDLQGKQVQFLAWNKIPNRNPSDRIAKVG